MGAVSDTPFLDHAADGVVRDEAAVGNEGEWEELVGEGTREVACFEPGFNASAIVRDSGGEGDGVFH